MTTLHNLIWQIFTRACIFIFGKNAFSAFSRSQEFAKKLCSNNWSVRFSVRMTSVVRTFLITGGQFR